MMDVSIRRKIVGVLLIIAFPASVILADPGMSAMLHTSGSVAVNGAGAKSTAAVFAGDRISTTNQAAVISMPGSTIVLPADSTLVYQGKSVELNSGRVGINTSQGMTAQVSGYTVSPARGAARYEIAKLDGAFLVAAEKGDVVVSDGTSSTVVQEGKSQTTEEPQPPAAAQKKKKKKRAGAVPPAGATQSAGGVTRGALGALVAGGVVAGIVASVVTTGPPESRDRR